MTNRFDAPLHLLDTDKQTFGCRHTNPDICARHSSDECAFVRTDKLCLKPSKAWPKQYEKLKAKKQAVS